MRTRRLSRGAGLALAGALLALSASSKDAEAQAMPAVRGFNVNRFEPSVAGDVFFGQDFGQYTGATRIWQLRGGLLFDYAYQPLVYRNADGSVANSVIDHSLAMHAQLALALLNRFDINLSLPVTLLDHSGSNNGAGFNIRALGVPSVGDLRVGARVRFFGEADRSPFSLHLGAQLFLGGLWTPNGSGNMGSFTNSDNGITMRAYLTAAGRVSILRYGVSAGFHYRPNAMVDTFNPPTTIGSEVFGTAAIGIVLANERLMIGAEGYLGLRVTQGFQANTGFLAGEANVGVHYTIADLIMIGAGVGPGFSQAPGTPTVRALLTASYSPIYRPPVVRPDRDQDGVFDDEDLCPDEPMGATPDPARRGCPLRDRDHDGVLDNDDQCPDTPQGEHPDPERRGCPDGDDDSDGVLNHADQCRTVPQGEHPDPERTGCPDGDDDNDGVLNHADQCRTEPQGAHPDPARPGCPVADRDHDTVPDNVDHCPDQPGAPHPDPNRNGCPGQVRVENGMLRLLAPVFFATNRDVILPRSFAVLQAVADALRASPEIRRVAIEGHTDDVGDDARNMNLSQRRAQSVVRWLTEHQIDAGRMEAHGFGETRPLVQIASLRGRQLSEARGQNRRVDFRIVDPAPPAGSQGAAQGGAH